MRSGCGYWSQSQAVSFSDVTAWPPARCSGPGKGSISAISNSYCGLLALYFHMKLGKTTKQNMVFPNVLLAWDVKMLA